MPMLTTDNFTSRLPPNLSSENEYMSATEHEQPLRVPSRSIGVNIIGYRAAVGPYQAALSEFLSTKKSLKN